MRPAVLDDLKLIHTRDSKDALGIAEKQWQQYKHNFDFQFSSDRPINKVVVSGMGGSGLAAKVFKSWPGVGVPFEIIQDYSMPGYIDQNTLVIVSSYSGNTEEMLTDINGLVSPDLPEERRPIVVVISSGGQLQEIASQNNLPFVSLPSGYQPRMTLGYQLRALCQIFESYGLIHDTLRTLDECADWLKDRLEPWQPTVPTEHNYAKQLAQDIVGKAVVVYASGQFAPVAYKWKISINENAKSLAWWDQYPEFDHNEMLGWTNQPVEKLYSVVDLRSHLDNPRVQKRFEISEQLLSGKRPSPEVVNLEGDDLLKQIMWGIALGDFVSIYTAILSGVDPTPVDLIENFKHKLE